MVPLLEVRLPARRASHPLTEILHREGAEARLIACRLVERRPRRLLRWLDVSVPTERREHLVRALQRRLRPQEFALAPVERGRLLLRILEAAPADCTATHRVGGICVSCPLVGREEAEGWRIVLPRGPQTHAFLRSLPSVGAGRPAIARLKPYRSPATLTRRQDRALRVAYDLGYFDYPRRGSLGDVAKTLGVGRSATLEILRRATSKLAGGRYRDELRARTVQ